MAFTKEYLEELRALPLDAKILKSKQRIREWYYHFGGKVYVSYSGGKDSTVLLHLVRSIFPDVPAVYCDTGLEYPELKASVRSIENCEIIRPKKTFTQVITEYGYPIVSKDVAEAIHYARKILRGGATAIRKRIELEGRRTVAHRTTGERIFLDSGSAKEEPG